MCVENSAGISALGEAGGLSASHTGDLGLSRTFASLF